MLKDIQEYQRLTDKIDQMQKLMLESIGLLYIAAYNDAIEDAANQVDGGLNRYAIMKLKK